MFSRNTPSHIAEHQCTAGHSLENAALSSRTTTRLILFSKK